MLSDTIHHACAGRFLAHMLENMAIHRVEFLGKNRVRFTLFARFDFDDNLSVCWPNRTSRYAAISFVYFMAEPRMGPAIAGSFLPPRQCFCLAGGMGIGITGNAEKLHFRIFYAS